MSRRSNCSSRGNGPEVFSGVSEHVPSASNAAAVSGDCADAATVVTASEAAVEEAVAALVLGAADVAGVADVAAVEEADGDEFEQAAPARPSTAIPPIRRKVRRSARAPP